MPFTTPRQSYTYPILSTWSRFWLKNLQSRSSSFGRGVDRMCVKVGGPPALCKPLMHLLQEPGQHLKPHMAWHVG